MNAVLKPHLVAAHLAAVPLAAAPLAEASPAQALLDQARAGTLSLAQVMEHAQQLQNSGQAEVAAQLYERWITHTEVPLKQVACFNWGTLLSSLNRDDEAEQDRKSVV